MAPRTAFEPQRRWDIENSIAGLVVGRRSTVVADLLALSASRLPRDAGHEELFAAPGSRHSGLSRQKTQHEAGIVAATGDLRLGR